MCMSMNYLCQYKTIKNIQNCTKKGMIMVIKSILKYPKSIKLEKSLISKSSKVECKLSKITELSGGQYHNPM